MPILGCWTLIVTGSVFGEHVTIAYRQEEEPKEAYREVTWLLTP